MSYKTNRLDQAIDDEVLESVRRAVREDKAREKKKTSGLFFRFIKLMFPNPNLLTKSEITNSDINSTQTELMLESIYEKVQTETENLSRDPRFSHTSCYRLYDKIIEKVTKKDRLWILIMHLAEIGLVIYAYDGCYDLVFRITGESLQPRTLFRIVTHLAVLMIGISLHRYLRTKCNEKEFQLRMKTKQCLKMIIYNKLVTHEQAYLQNCDDSTLHRLFFWHLEDFAVYSSTVMSWFKLVAWWLAYVRYLEFPGLEKAGFLFFWVTTGIISFYLVFVVRRGTNKLLSLRQNMLKERELLFEALQNFKSFHFSNQLAFYKSKFNRLEDSKASILKDIHLSNSSSERAVFYFPFYGPLIYFIFVLLIHMNDLKEGGVINSTHPEATFLRLATVIAHLTMATNFSGILQAVLTEMSDKKRRDFAKQFYDKFFEEDYSISQSIRASAELRLGEVELESLEVYERLQENHRLILGSTVKLESTTKPPVKQVLKQAYIFRKENQFKGLFRRHMLTKQPTSQRTPAVAHKSSKVFPLTARPTQKQQVARLVFKNFTCKIFAGEFFCILWSMRHTHSINGFFNLLLGENILKSGTARCNGKVSYFGQSRMPFLPGKTIRENILFGEEYQMERYHKVLQAVGAKFEKYLGRDFYQVCEKAHNIQTDDRLLILLSRFLYRDAQIYLLEDLFINFSCAANQSLLDRVFLQFLKGKTVVYASKLREPILWANRLLRFKSNYKTKIYDQAEIRAHLLERLESLTFSRKATSNGRIKNSIFIANTSFEEELAIHKKQEIERKDIERIKLSSTNKLEKIVYGIYLIHKKRTEGQNISQTSTIDQKELDDICGLVLGFKYPFQQKQTLLPLLCKILTRLFLTAAECLLITRCFDPHTLLPRFKLFDLVSVILSILLSFCCRVMDDIKRSEANVVNFRSINQKLLSNIFKADYSTISSIYPHEILSASTDEMLKVYLDLYLTVNSNQDHLISLISSGLLLSVIYSFLFPLIILAIYCALSLYLLRRFLRGYMKAISLTHFNRQVKHAFFFQLPRLIFGYRVASALHKLNQKFLRLSDNLVRNEKLILVDYKMLFMRLNSIMQIFVVSCFMGLFVTFMRTERWNYLGLNHLWYIWSIPLLYRLIYHSDSILFGLLANLINMIDSLKTDSFVCSDPARNPLSRHEQIFQLRSRLNSEIETAAFSHKLDFQKPIQFKNVSLTLGYQVILKQLTCSVKPRQMVALLGIDGSGRSSIFDLILGIKQKDCKQNSSIKIFGVPVESLRDQEKIQLHFIDKSGQLYEGTIRSNIDPTSECSDQEIIYILNQFGIAKLLKTNYHQNVEKLKLTILQGNEQHDGEDNSRITNFGQPISQATAFLSVNFSPLKKKTLLIRPPNPSEFAKPIEPFGIKESNPDDNSPSLQIPLSASPQNSPNHALVTAINSISLKNGEEERKRANREGLVLDFGKSKPKFNPSFTLIGSKNSIILQKEDITSSEDDFAAKIQSNQQRENNQMDHKSPLKQSPATSPDLEGFLKLSVQASGRNVDPSLRNLICFARAVLQKPKLLLAFEEVLSWTDRITETLEILRRSCPETTILMITESNRSVLAYDQILLMDGGMLIDSGEPQVLLKNKESIFMTYMKETDLNTYELLKSECAKLAGLNPRSDN